MLTKFIKNRLKRSKDNIKNDFRDKQRQKKTEKIKMQASISSSGHAKIKNIIAIASGKGGVGKSP